MAEILLMKAAGALRPTDEDSLEWLSKLPKGKEVLVEAKRPRNARQHRLFFAALKLVHDALPDAARERYPTPEALRAALLIHLGYVAGSVVTKDGLVVHWPRSMAFHCMPQEEFDALMNGFFDWVAADVIPGVGQDDLRRELEEIVA